MLLLYTFTLLGVCTSFHSFIPVSVLFSTFHNSFSVHSLSHLTFGSSILNLASLNHSLLISQCGWTACNRCYTPVVQISRRCPQLRRKHPVRLGSTAISIAKANKSYIYHLPAERAPLNSNPAPRTATSQEFHATQVHSSPKY
jgi:hypothetical protein